MLYELMLLTATQEWMRAMLRLCRRVSARVQQSQHNRRKYHITCLRAPVVRWRARSLSDAIVNVGSSRLSQRAKKPDGEVHTKRKPERKHRREESVTAQESKSTGYRHVGDEGARVSRFTFRVRSTALRTCGNEGLHLKSALCVTVG
jgi:hypothetical protein